MRQSATAEQRNSAQSAANPKRAAFARLLGGHLENGTRPNTSAVEPWTYAEFAGEIESSRGDTMVSPRSVSNWCNARSVPGSIDPICQALFGPETSNRHAAARDELRASFGAARAEKSATVIARARRDPAGARVVIVNADEGGDAAEYALDESARPTDRRAAADPLRRQLQEAIREAAAKLAAATKEHAGRRYDNSTAWRDLPEIAARFRALIDDDPLRLPDRLGEAYALMLRLGRFLETDRKVQGDPMADDAPLQTDDHGLLTDVVRAAAPWLRGFPTIAKWDDEAGKALVRAAGYRTLREPARDFAAAARNERAIAEHDAATLALLAAAAQGTAAEDDFLGDKAGARLVGNVRNLILAAAELYAAALSGAAPSGLLSLASRAGVALAAASPSVARFAAAAQGDLGEALRGLAAEGGRLPAPPRAPQPPVPEAVPEDVEARARDMILDGRSPPESWVLHIRRLIFPSGTFNRADLLAGLAGLQTLSLDSTQVADVTPLAGLAGLQELYLSYTQVADVAPLAGLAGLQTLSLSNTQVADVAPLAGLAGLQELYLNNTQVADVAPLAGLAGLQTLYLNNTQVADVAPLAGLAGLQALSLDSTQVADLAPLAGLSGLQELYLDNTQVADVSPLAGLSGLQELWLGGTQVADVAPLAHLTNLRIYGGPEQRPPAARRRGRRG